MVALAQDDAEPGGRGAELRLGLRDPALLPECGGPQDSHPQRVGVTVSPFGGVLGQDLAEFGLSIRGPAQVGCRERAAGPCYLRTAVPGTCDLGHAPHYVVVERLGLGGSAELVHYFRTPAPSVCRMTLIRQQAVRCQLGKLPRYALGVR